jgi:hypothetical protein
VLDWRKYYEQWWTFYREVQLWRSDYTMPLYGTGQKGNHQAEWLWCVQNQNWKYFAQR